MQGGRRLAEVVGHRGLIADQLVAARQLEVGEAGCPQVVRDFRLLQRPAVQRDRPRLIAARRRQPSMKTPQMRQRGRRDRFADAVRGTAKRRAGLREVVLQEPRLGENDAQREFVLARKRRGSQRLLEGLRGLGAAAPLERGLCARHDPLERHAHHGRQYTSLARLAGPAIPTLV